ncbi:MAG: tRNA (N(6)-L-threonylcarbamoyladenosine(37)-C(2))-methylthiotransferase MtaB [Clostridia bacterium]|nr:tRNA (N(6)-L-threonylcarbamoyladenosine(37)-C(2))-methylthiotransferase MtaB [Clostridia bacterium]
MSKIKASIITLGCRVNQYESDAIMQELSKNGVEICSGNEICDIYIINTCSVTSESDRKSKQLVRRCISKNKDAVIIVTGCFSQINPEKALKIEGVDFVCGNNAKSIIAKKALELYKEKREPFMYVPDIFNCKFDVMQVGAPLTRTRAFIKIQDGCESKCAYCIIPYARGNVRSNSPENVINEVKNIVSEGCYEVVLTGIETAAYGRDFKNGYTLADLLTEINKIEGLKRIRLGSLDPAAITCDFVDKIKVLDKVMPHFHISMQSGSTRILNLMKRKYNMDMARKNIHYLKECIPNVMLSADIITGFPQETDEDFFETLEFFRQERFLHIHIFPYSKREGTVAATMSGQVAENIKKERLHQLEEQQKEIRRDMLNRIVDDDAELEVLCETFDGEFVLGHTTNFLEVRIPSDKKISNEFVKVKPFATDGDYIYADIIK